MPSKFPISILASEIPLDGASVCVTVNLPSGYFGCENVDIGQAAIEALLAANLGYRLPIRLAQMHLCLAHEHTSECRVDNEL